jgi:hypothetical protein
MTLEQGIEFEMARIWVERGDGEFPTDRQFEELRHEAELELSDDFAEST